MMVLNYISELVILETDSSHITIREGNEGYVIYSDASQQGFGCVLMQNGKMVAYASR